MHAVAGEATDAMAALMATNAWDDMLVTALVADESIGWLAVGRSEAAEGFVEADAQLFEALAKHAARRAAQRGAARRAQRRSTRA